MEARALSRLFALGLTVAVGPLLGCDRVNDSDGGGDGGAGDGTPTIDEVGQAFCEHQLECYGQYEPGYTVEACVGDFEDTFAYYDAYQSEVCQQALLEYYSCLSALECGAFEDYYDGEDNPGAEPPCVDVANEIDLVCESESTEPSPGDEGDPGSDGAP